MKNGVFLRQADGTKKLLKWVKQLPSKDVLVGIPAEKAGRRSGEITNAQLGYIHEYGAPDAGIPARPSLFPGIRDVKGPIAKQLALAVKLNMKGRLVDMDRSLHAAGMIAVSAVLGRIKRSDGFAPLKASTIRRRRVRSKGSKYRRQAVEASQVTPLIDTGQFIRSFTYLVRGAKDGA